MAHAKGAIAPRKRLEEPSGTPRSPLTRVRDSPSAATPPPLATGIAICACIAMFARGASGVAACPACIPAVPSLLDPTGPRDRFLSTPDCTHSKRHP
jgi:hypothetical protein